MRVEDLSFSDPQENLIYDDQLLVRAEKMHQGEVLRFWESTSLFVVLGRTCDPALEVDDAACHKAGIPVLRRSSGGGTVMQGPGCLNFSLVLSRERHPDLASITGSYVYILSRVVSSLKICGVEAEFRPVCDLITGPDEKKISGNAQRRSRTHVLHHGTILYGFDLSLVSRYLREPPKMPVYRRQRPHEAFITNTTLDAARFKAVLARMWDGMLE